MPRFQLSKINLAHEREHPRGRETACDGKTRLYPTVVVQCTFKRISPH